MTNFINKTAESAKWIIAVAVFAGVTAIACSSDNPTATPGRAAEASPTPQTPTVVAMGGDETFGARVTIILPPFKAGEAALMEVFPEQNNDVGVTKIRITVTRATAEATVSIEKVAPPFRVAAPAKKVFSYLEINAGQIPDDAIEKVTIDFTVPTAWLRENRIPEEDIVLLRFTENSWTALSTRRVDATGGMVTYQAVSQGTQPILHQ
jgi:PGF-pre-PGF domain-containing protein